jgi:hypothetical protein
MAVDHVKSTPITNLDAIPAVQNTAGEGGPAPLKTIDGFAVVIASGSVGATYQLVRVPSNCKVKAVVFESEAQGAGKFNLGVYYATNGEGGQPTSLLVAAAINANLFATDIDTTSAISPTNEVNQSGNYTLDKRTQPLWQAAGLSTDPGGYFDIVATVHTTAVTTGTGRIGLKVEYTD